MYFEVGWLFGILLLSQLSNEWLVVRASFGGVLFSAIGLIPFITRFRLRGPLTWFGSALFIVAIPNWLALQYYIAALTWIKLALLAGEIILLVTFITKGGELITRNLDVHPKASKVTTIIVAALSYIFGIWMLCSVLFGQKVSRAYIFMGLVTLAVNVVFHVLSAYNPQAFMWHASLVFLISTWQFYQGFQDNLIYLGEAAYGIDGLRLAVGAVLSVAAMCASPLMFFDSDHHYMGPETLPSRFKKTLEKSWIVSALYLCYSFMVLSALGQIRSDGGWSRIIESLVFGFLCIYWCLKETEKVD